MKKCLTLAIAALLGVVATTSAMADVTGSGAGDSFTDNGGGSSVITIGTSESITDVEVVLTGLTHTWVGDLQLTLTGPDGTVMSLFDGIGSVGNGGAGDSSDFGGDYTIVDGGADLWAAAAAGANADVIAPGAYFATDLDNNALSFAATFAGKDTAGDWTLSHFDRAGGDTGAFTGWTLNITSAAVPEPGMIGLISLAGLGLVVRRRR